MRGIFLRRVFPVGICTVTVTGTGNTSRCYLTINGQKTFSAGTHEVARGDVVECFVSGSSDTVRKIITVNGETVLNDVGTAEKTYSYFVRRNAVINLAYVAGMSGGSTITITEE